MQRIKSRVTKLVVYIQHLREKARYISQISSFLSYHNSYTAELQALGHLITYIILPCK